VGSIGLTLTAVPNLIVKNINMRREILFRGLTTDKREWIYGSLSLRESVSLIGGYIITSPTQNDPCGDTIWHEELVIRGSVGEFCGVFDKKDNKLFEGDKVLLKDGNKGVVKFCRQRAAFIIEYQIEPYRANHIKEFDVTYGDGDVYIDTSIELIGNIHQK
jgi:hypothetical protein